jgi:hypothetical protein
MELRFMSGHADVQVGDVLQTSGLDGVYPPGLPVASVSSVERRAEAGFARIGLVPAAPARRCAPRAGAGTVEGLQLPPRGPSRRRWKRARLNASSPGRIAAPPPAHDHRAGPHHDHAARVRPAAAAGQPLFIAFTLALAWA